VIRRDVVGIMRSNDWRGGMTDRRGRWDRRGGCGWIHWILGIGRVLLGIRIRSIEAVIIGFSIYRRGRSTRGKDVGRVAWEKPSIITVLCIGLKRNTVCGGDSRSHAGGRI
jgi:hypothetical protein